MNSSSSAPTGSRRRALLEVEWVDFTPEPLRNLENRV
jgi:hypothetical protein